MTDDRDPEDQPDYRVHRAGRPGRDGPAGRDRGRGERPPYTVYRARPRSPLARIRGDEAEAFDRITPAPSRRGRRARRPFSLGRLMRFAGAAVAGWLLLSLVLFLVSAQLGRDDVSDAARSALSGGGYTLTSPNTILVLGSDARTEKTNEPGSTVGGRGRADSILLIRTGGGASARLSISRDTIVDIPGSGPDKINSAYAIGGPALAIETVEQFLGIQVNHVIEVDFENFPDLIDAMGGIDFNSRVPVLARINGGRSNGGTTVRLRKGTNHLDGDQALAVARVRRNLRRPAEDDLDRAARQQELLASMKGRLTSLGTFVRLPWVSWAAPKAIRSDMGGPSLLGVFGALTISSSPKPRVLKPSGSAPVAGGEGLVVSEAEKRRAVARFLRG